MKKFILVNLPTSENAYNSFRDFVAIQPPIGITTIAAVLEKKGYDVKIVDGDAENLSLEETVSLTVKEAPDFVGSTTMTATMDITGRFYSLLKEQLPDVTTIIGGPHVSAIPEETLIEFVDIDIAVIGEGDETISDLMSALKKGEDLDSVNGISYRKDRRIVRTAARPPMDLENALMPAYHLLNFDLYRSYGWNRWVSGYRTPLGIVSMGRGCYGKCNFCASHCVFGKGMRFFPMEKTKAEIDLLVRRYDIRVLYFQDDTFTVNRNAVNEICDYIIERGYHHRLEIMVSARVDTLHPPTLKKMRQAGVRWICFGVESGNQGILDKMHKRINIRQIRDAFNRAHEAGIFVAGNYMIGHLGETWETAMDTINLALDLKQEYASFAIAIPFPGTEIYKYCLDNGIELPAWNDFGSVNSPPIPLNESLDRSSLVTLRSMAVNRFFKRPSYVTGLLWKFNTWAVIKDFLKMYFAIRKEKKQNRF